MRITILCELCELNVRTNELYEMVYECYVPKSLAHVGQEIRFDGSDAIYVVIRVFLDMPFSIEYNFCNPRNYNEARPTILRRDKIETPRDNNIESAVQ